MAKQSDAGIGVGLLLWLCFACSLGSCSVPIFVPERWALSDGGQSPEPRREGAGFDSSPDWVPEGGRVDRRVAELFPRDARLRDAISPQPELRPCTKVAYYRDSDGDGFGTTATKTLACPGQEPLRYVQKHGDCNDRDRRAFPGQIEWFPTPITGTNSYDFNCDGRETMRYRVLLQCDPNTRCSLVKAGYYQTLPPCGTIASYYSSCSLQPLGGAMCRPLTSKPLRQECR